MKKSMRVSSLLIVLVLGVGINKASGKTFQCPSAGFFADTNCRVYYECVEWGTGLIKPHRYECGLGTVFSPLRGNTCTRPKDSGRLECRNEGLNFSSEENELPNGSALRTSGLHLPAMSATASIGHKFQQLAKNVPSIKGEFQCTREGFASNPYDCRIFHRCVKEGRHYKRYDFICPTATIWDPKHEVCNHAWAVTRTDCKDHIPSTEHPTYREKSNHHKLPLSSDGPNQSITPHLHEWPEHEKPDHWEQPDTERSHYQEQPDHHKRPDLQKQPDHREWREDQKWPEHETPDHKRPHHQEQPEDERSYHQKQAEHHERPDHEKHDHWKSDHQEQPEDERPYHQVQPEHHERPDHHKRPDHYKRPDYHERSDHHKQPDHDNRPDPQIKSPRNNIHSPKQSVTENVQGTCTREGYFGVPSDCRKFYRCIRFFKTFRKFNFKCAPGTAWDDSIGRCNHDYLVVNCNKTPENKNETAYLPPTTELPPMSYLPPKATTPTTISWTKPTPSSTDETFTERPSSTGASNPSTSTYTPTVDTPMGISINESPCRNEGFFPDPNNCTKFYRCVKEGFRYRKYTFDCAPGTAWDQKLQTCNFIHLVTSCKNENNQNSGSTELAEESTTEQTKPAEEQKPTEESVSQDGTPLEELTTEEQKPTEESASEAGIPTEVSASPEGTPTEESMSEEQKPTEESATEQGRPTEESGSEESTPTEESMSEEQKPTEESATEQGRPTDEPGSEEATPTEESASEGQNLTEESVSQEGITTDESATEQASSTMESTSEEGKPTEESVSVEQKPTEESATEQGTPTVESASQEGKPTEKPSSEQGKPTEESPSQEGTSTDESVTEEESTKELTTEEHNPTEESVSEEQNPTEESATEQGRPTEESASQEGRPTEESTLEPGRPTEDSASQEGTPTDESATEEEVTMELMTEEQTPTVGSPSEEQNRTEESATEEGRPTEESGSEEGTPTEESASEEQKPTNESVSEQGNPTEESASEEGRPTEESTSEEGRPTEESASEEGRPSEESTSEEGRPTEESASEEVNPTEESTSEEGKPSHEEPNTISPGVTVATSPLPQPTMEAKIVCTMDGFYMHPTHCSKFYRCVAINKGFTVYYFNCPPGTIFDPTINLCNYMDTVYPMRQCHMEPPQTTTMGMLDNSADQTTREEITSTTHAMEQPTTAETTMAVEPIGTEATVEPTNTETTTRTTVESTNTETTTRTTVDLTSTGTTMKPSTEELTESKPTEAVNPTTIPISVTVTPNPQESCKMPAIANTTCPVTNVSKNQIALVCPTGFRRHPKNCNLFYQCLVEDEINVKVLVLACPAGTVYDNKMIQCVPEFLSNEKCIKPLTMSIQSEEDMIAQESSNYYNNVLITSKQLCPTQGVHLLRKQCSSEYYKCTRDDTKTLQGYLYQCPPGHVYSSAKNGCQVATSLAECAGINFSRNKRQLKYNSQVPIERFNH